MGEVKQIPESLTYNRTPEQKALIEAAGEVAAEIPELTGYVVIGFNHEVEYACWHAWPCSENELPDYVQDMLKYWISELI